MTTPFPFVAGAVLTAAELNAITTLPINDQTDDYTLVVGDVGKRVIMNKGTANTVTVDDSIFAAGDTIFIANKGAGTSTITAGAGVTINSASGLALVTSQSGQLVALSASSFLFVASDVTAAPSAVLQVVSTTKQDTFSASAALNASVDVTGLAATITPSSASSQVLVTVNMNGLTEVSGTYRPFFVAQLKRGASLIGGGTAAGNRVSANMAGSGTSADNSLVTSLSFSFLDSPATTSATTYQVVMLNIFAGTNTLRMNSIGNDADSADRPRLSSTITVMEVTP